ALVVNSDRLPMSAHGFLSIFLELIKIRITFFVGMSALFGYVLANKMVTLRMLEVSLGIFFLACASAALNHFQERRTDRLMHRTCNRPLPMGMISGKRTVMIIVLLALIGSTMIMYFGNYTAFGLSLLALISYNVIYTPLKKVSSFAVIPGSLVGVFPVLAGWASANGDLLSPKILSIALFFFVWQIPHFWLLMELYSVDYRRAGFPTLQMRFRSPSIKAMIFFSIVLLVMCSLAFSFSGAITRIIPEMLVGLSGIWLILESMNLLEESQVVNRVIKSTFLKLNMYVLAVTLVIFLDNLI
ncbi:MAG: protoheme IX farnesyltransferase, partial [Candidatus Kryptoniota bacterium]